MKRRVPPGLRCTVCNHLIGRTTSWALLACTRPNRHEILCSECSDDLLAHLALLRRELVTEST